MKPTFAHRQIAKLRDLITPSRQKTEFAADPDAHRLCRMMEALQRGAYVPSSFRDEVDRLTEEVTRGIRAGRLVLDYQPVDTDKVTLPGMDEPLYMQAVLYWCSRIVGPMPRLIEACVRAGDGATVALVEQTMEKIELENRMSKTDVFFAGAMR